MHVCFVFILGRYSVPACDVPRQLTLEAAILRVVMLAAFFQLRCKPMFFLDRYVKDEASGDVIWPENWQKELNPSTEQMPWRYMIVERDHFPRFDQSKTRAKFDGDAVGLR